ncbi:FAD-dependent oxidoreductase [Ramlibacter sp. AN1015]|uniref:NAD(P)/FAD-dependent oxidoreductase n=1 Tax=Ramlibacter sp. AN1015 TaxID=3133428 RepID=UPI0030BB25DC
MHSGVVIVGGGQGGFQAAASLRDEGYDGPIALICDEAVLPYQRPPLSKGFLTGKTAPAQLQLRPDAFYAERNIEVLVNERVTSINRAARNVTLASGATRPWSHLVLATGSIPRMPPVPGADLAGVQTLRTSVDAQVLLERLQGQGQPDKPRRLVVVGAGFVGLEVAVVARELGLDVDLLEFGARALQRSVSAEAAGYLSDALQRRGARIHFSTGAAAFVGAEGQVRAVRTHRGDVLDADLVVVGIGVEPDDRLARAAGLAVDDGVLVDEYLVSSDPAISALGDCARFPAAYAAQPVRLESVQNAVDQARCVAARLAGKPAPYDKVPWFWSDQGDNRLQIAGVAAAGDQAVLRGSAAEGRFSVLRLRDGHLSAVESINNAADHMAARKLLAARVAITPEQAADTSVKLASLAAVPA